MTSYVWLSTLRSFSRVISLAICWLLLATLMKTKKAVILHAVFYSPDAEKFQLLHLRA